MKKLLTIFFSVFLISQSSFAGGFFVGADLLRSDVRQQTKGSNSLGKKSDNQTGFGINAGLRGDILLLNGSVELFYDNLNLSTKAISSNNDRMKVQNRYGAKANIGMTVFPFVTPFVTFGLSHLNYELSNNSISGADSDSKFSPLYGVGVLVDLPLEITLKASYDYQQFSGSAIRNHLGVARVGVIYNF